MNFEQFLSFLRICMYILYIIKTIDYKKLQNSGYIAILYPALVNFGPAATHCYMRFRTLIHYFIFMDLELCSVDVFVLLLFSKIYGYIYNFNTHTYQNFFFLLYAGQSCGQVLFSRCLYKRASTVVDKGIHYRVLNSAAIVVLWSGAAPGHCMGCCNIFIGQNPPPIGSPF